MTEAMCSKKVDRGSSRMSNWQDCGRVAVEDGLCKVHLSLRKRADAKNTKQMETEARCKAHLQECEDIGAVLGTQVDPYYNYNVPFGSGYDNDDFVVTGDWIRSIAATRKVEG